jgi:ribonuclease-3
VLSKSAAWLKKALDYEFREDALLQQALTHRSVAGTNNERLEFLGDAVLDTVISEVVYRLEPGASEGALSRLRSYLVKDTMLAQLALELGVGDHVVLGPGEKKAGGHQRASILADAIEAIFGAVYLDRGFEAACAVVQRAYGPRLTELPDAASLRDPKTRLQELLQARRKNLPRYSLEQVTGKAHAQTFEVRCEIAELNLESRGTGNSRRDAEQDAAAQLLVMIEKSQ